MILQNNLFSSWKWKILSYAPYSPEFVSSITCLDHGYIQKKKNWSIRISFQTVVRFSLMNSYTVRMMGKIVGNNGQYLESQMCHKFFPTKLRISRKKTAEVKVYAYYLSKMFSCALSIPLSKKCNALVSLTFK